MIATAAHLRCLRPIAAQLLSAVSPVLPAAATLGATGFATLLVVRVATLLGQRPNGSSVPDRESHLTRPAGVAASRPLDR